MYDVSFPGLGIENLHINDTAFQLFGRDIKWYGVIITFGMILACLYALSRCKFEKISSDDFTDYALFAIIFGILGARLYYVLFHLDTYLVTSYTSAWRNIKETFLAMISIWNGGLAIYGGIIAGGIVIALVSKKKKIKVTKFLDVAAPSVMIGQIFGRWGNFMNQEAFGTNTTLPWGMYSNGTYDYLLRHRAELEKIGITVDPTLPVHPTFLYESLWNAIGFVIIHFIYKKKKYDGQIFLLYAAWYGFGRMIIEEFRTDSLMIGPFRVSQLVALISFLAAAIILLVFSLKKKTNISEENQEEQYEPVFADGASEGQEDVKEVDNETLNENEPQTDITEENNGENN